jgi:2-dehydro-3-deoxyphosphooctonate aldolase (KDO 8-P synthase)
VHEAPERALSDGPNALPLARMAALLKTLRDLHELVRRTTSEVSEGAGAGL